MADSINPREALRRCLGPAVRAWAQLTGLADQASELTGIVLDNVFGELPISISSRRRAVLASSLNQGSAPPSAVAQSRSSREPLIVGWIVPSHESVNGLQLTDGGFTVMATVESARPGLVCGLIACDSWRLMSSANAHVILRDPELLFTYPELLLSCCRAVASGSLFVGRNGIATITGPGPPSEPTAPPSSSKATSSAYHLCGEVLSLSDDFGGSRFLELRLRRTCPCIPPRDEGSRSATVAITTPAATGYLQQTRKPGAAGGGGVDPIDPRSSGVASRHRGPAAWDGSSSSAVADDGPDGPSDDGCLIAYVVTGDPELLRAWPCALHPGMHVCVTGLQKASLKVPGVGDVPHVFRTTLPPPASGAQLSRWWAAPAGGAPDGSGAGADAHASSSNVAPPPATRTLAQLLQVSADALGVSVMPPLTVRRVASSGGRSLLSRCGNESCYRQASAPPPTSSAAATSVPATAGLDSRPLDVSFTGSITGIQRVLPRADGADVWRLAVEFVDLYRVWTTSRGLGPPLPPHVGVGAKVTIHGLRSILVGEGWHVGFAQLPGRGSVRLVSAVKAHSAAGATAADTSTSSSLLHIAHPLAMATTERLLTYASQETMLRLNAVGSDASASLGAPRMSAALSWFMKHGQADDRHSWGEKLWALHASAAVLRVALASAMAGKLPLPITGPAELSGSSGAPSSHLAPYRHFAALLGLNSGGGSVSATDLHPTAAVFIGALRRLAGALPPRNEVEFCALTADLERCAKVAAALPQGNATAPLADMVRFFTGRDSMGPRPMAPSAGAFVHTPSSLQPALELIVEEAYRSAHPLLCDPLSNPWASPAYQDDPVAWAAAARRTTAAIAAAVHSKCGSAGVSVSVAGDWLRVSVASTAACLAAPFQRSCLVGLEMRAAPAAPGPTASHAAINGIKLADDKAAIALRYPATGVTRAASGSSSTAATAPLGPSEADAVTLPLRVFDSFVLHIDIVRVPRKPKSVGKTKAADTAPSHHGDVSSGTGGGGTKRQRSSVTSGVSSAPAPSSASSQGAVRTAAAAAVAATPTAPAEPLFIQTERRGAFVKSAADAGSGGSLTTDIDTVLALAQAGALGVGPGASDAYRGLKPGWHRADPNPTPTPSKLFPSYSRWIWSYRAYVEPVDALPAAEAAAPAPAAAAAPPATGAPSTAQASASGPAAAQPFSAPPAEPAMSVRACLSALGSLLSGTWERVGITPAGLASAALALPPPAGIESAGPESASMPPPPRPPLVTAPSTFTVVGVLVAVIVDPQDTYFLPPPQEQKQQQRGAGTSSTSSGALGPNLGLAMGSTIGADRATHSGARWMAPVTLPPPPPLASATASAVPPAITDPFARFVGLGTRGLKLKLRLRHVDLAQLVRSGSSSAGVPAPAAASSAAGASSAAPSPPSHSGGDSDRLLLHPSFAAPCVADCVDVFFSPHDPPGIVLPHGFGPGALVALSGALRVVSAKPGAPQRVYLTVRPPTGGVKVLGSFRAEAAAGLVSLAATQPLLDLLLPQPPALAAPAPFAPPLPLLPSPSPRAEGLGAAMQAAAADRSALRVRGEVSKLLFASLFWIDMTDSAELLPARYGAAAGAACTLLGQAAVRPAWPEPAERALAARAQATIAGAGGARGRGKEPPSSSSLGPAYIPATAEIRAALRLEVKLVIDDGSGEGVARADDVYTLEQVARWGGASAVVQQALAAASARPVRAGPPPVGASSSASDSDLPQDAPLGAGARLLQLHPHRLAFWAAAAARYGRLTLQWGLGGGGGVGGADGDATVEGGGSAYQYWQDYDLTADTARAGEAGRKAAVAGLARASAGAASGAAGLIFDGLRDPLPSELDGCAAPQLLASPGAAGKPVAEQGASSGGNGGGGVVLAARARPPQPLLPPYAPVLPFTDATSASSSLFREVLLSLAAQPAPRTVAMPRPDTGAAYSDDDDDDDGGRGASLARSAIPPPHRPGLCRVPAYEWELLVRRTYHSPKETAGDAGRRETAWRRGAEAAAYVPLVRDALLAWARGAVGRVPSVHLPLVTPAATQPPPPPTSAASTITLTTPEAVSLLSSVLPRPTLRIVAARGIPESEVHSSVEGVRRALAAMRAVAGTR